MITNEAKHYIKLTNEYKNKIKEKREEAEKLRLKLDKLYRELTILKKKLDESKTMANLELFGKPL